MRNRSISTCIKDGCGKRFDVDIPEQRDEAILRPFAMWYCPEHRVTGKYFEPITEKSINGGK
jgi:hypothetical protein